MPFERGRNNGVTGTIDVEGSPSFTVRVMSWKRRRNANIRNIRPRGQNWVLPRHMGEGADLLFVGKVQKQGYPEPSTLENSTGTITIQCDTGNKVVYSVRFTSVWYDATEKDTDFWSVTIGATVTAQPTSTWPGTQVTPSAPSNDEQETPDGVVGKVLDPKDLVESSTTVLDVYGVADSDAAEVTLIESYFTRTPPVTGHKVRSVSLTRAGKYGVIVTIQHGLRNTEDDVEMDGTTYNVDESNLQSSASVTIVESDSTPDGGVSVSGLVLRSTTKRQIHDSKWAITYNFAETTAEDDVEFPGTVTIADPRSIANSATVTIVNSSSTYPSSLDTPPTGLKLRFVHSQQLTNGDKWAHKAEYGRRNTEDDIEQGGTAYQIDQSTQIVAGSARVVVVESDSTPDGGVSVSGMVLRHIEKQQLHDSKWQITYVFGQSTPQEDVEFEGTSYENDPTDLTDSARVTLVTNSSTYPVALDTPPTSPTTAELKLRRIISRQLTSGSGRWVHTGVYATNTEEDDVENAGTFYTTDQSGNVIGGSAQVTVIEEDPIPDGGVTVSGLNLRYTTAKKINENKWAITYQFGQNTPEDDFELENTIYENDVSNLNDSAKVTLINGSATYPTALDTPPSTPTTATLKLIRVISRKLTTGSTKWAHTGLYGMRTPEDEVEQDGTTYNVDQSTNVIAGTARVTVVESDSTPDGGVSVSGLVLRYINKKQLNDGKWAISYEFGQNTPEDDLEFDATVYENDVSNLNDSARVALVNSSTTYPVALDTPPSTPATATLKLLRVISRQLTTAGKWLHVGVYGLRTQEDEIEYDGTVLSTDPAKGDDDTTTTVVNLADYTPSTLDGVRDTIVTTYLGDTSFDSVSVKQLTAAKAVVKLRTLSQDKVLIERIRTKYEYRYSRGSAVLVTRVVQETAGRQAAFVQPQNILVTSGEVRIRRRVVGSTRQSIFSAFDTTQYSGRVGTTNNAAFLGYPLKGLLYEGWDLIQDFGKNGSNHVIDIDFVFRLDSIGHYDDSRVGSGWFYPSSNVSLGYASASAFGFVITEPSTSDFSAFLA